MLEMEYMKLRQMEEYFKEMDTFVGIEYVRRDLRICLRLLDIVMERDDLDIKRSPLKFVPFKGDNGRKMYKLEGASEIISYKKLYVNTRNAARFIEFDFTSPNVDESSEISYKESLRLICKVCFCTYKNVRETFISVSICRRSCIYPACRFLYAGVLGSPYFVVRFFYFPARR